jgi:predicted nucleic acid-binding protein
MRVLIDTSIWSLALRRTGHIHSPEAVELKRLITNHLVEIIGPIRQEILSGVRDQSQFDQLESHLTSFPDLLLLSEDYVTAAKFFNLCSSKGIQGSNTDFLICAVAVRHDFAVFTTDGDFHQFAKCLPIVIHDFKKPATLSPVAKASSSSSTAQPGMSGTSARKARTSWARTPAP